MPSGVVSALIFQSAPSAHDSLRDMLHVFEIVVALRDAGRAPEVVERNGSNAALGKPQRELLVEAVEATHVREDHDAEVRRLVWLRHKGGEAVAVPRLEHEILV